MDDLKKIILAGIGGATLTYEKAEEMLDKLVGKGKLTVEQGKLLNQELIRKKKEHGSEETLSKEAVRELVETMETAQRKEIEKLERKVEELNEKIDKLNNR
ncbi:hypothetical protein [Carnobacterium sp.]|uniref:phasin family protein n=1 Tax=Carnobacterium sp. TaxID=48221 RepID=UPI0028B2425D|nr:hypothetical protein [Carnobacterium sp.]